MSPELQRRSFIQTAGAIAGAAAATGLIEQSALAQNASPTGARAMTYEAKPLSLDPKGIKGISEKVLVSHYENNYVGAVQAPERHRRAARRARFRQGAELRDQRARSAKS